MGQFCVYVLLDLTNGKRYVGKTKRPSRRMAVHKCHAKKGGGLAVNRAMAEHGAENFVFGIVEWFATEADAFEGERVTIRSLGTRDPLRGYNLTDGGQGGNGMIVSDETRRRLSESHKGQPGYWTGKKLPPHVVEMMSQRMKNMSEEARASLSFAMTGRVLPEATRAKIALAHKDRHFPPEHRARISEGNRRAWSKDRTARVFGEATKQAKLTAAVVPDIVAACDAGEHPQDVGARYGVHRRTIVDIIIGKTWKQVTGRNYAKAA